MFRVLLTGLLLTSSLCCADVEIIGNDGKPLAWVASDYSGFTVGNKKYLRKVSKSGKTKYLNASGYLMAKVNDSDKGFKLKSISGETLWKLKSKDYGLKIADNNEMDKAYKVKHKSAGYALMRGDKKLALVKSSGSDFKVLLGEQLLMTVRGGASPEYLTVLAIPEAKWEYRLILFTELLNSQAL